MYVFELSKYYPCSSIVKFQVIHDAWNQQVNDDDYVWNIL